MTLTQHQIDQFIDNGYVRVSDAFPSSLAARCREILWRDTGCDPSDRSTWTKPVIRLNSYNQTPFIEAANTSRLHKAFDQLVGKGNWFPRTSLGTFPIRFPSGADPGDTGWHVDSGFAGPDPADFSTWRSNIYSKGRSLLMLFLFSDVGDDDAPTVIEEGSHFKVARVLEHFGEEGLPFLELASKLSPDLRRTSLATGEAGTVYLCHPFLVHAAQPHRGTEPRFLAQPPLIPARPFDLYRPDGRFSPVEKAIRKAIFEAS